MTEEQKQRLRRDVAEKVMGLEHVGIYEYCELKQGNRTWFGYVADWMPQELESWESVQIISKSGVEGLLYWPRLEEVPEYERDIAAAWQVQERISINGLSKEVEYLDALLEIIPFTKLDWEYRKNGTYQLGVTLQYLMVSATPEQRCLAAYKAVTGQEWK